MLIAQEWAGMLPGRGLEGPGPTHPHALAARAVYGQPHGFTPVMLAAVRYIGWTGGASVQIVNTLGGMAAVWYDSVIDRGIEQAITRVEALLPPE